MAEIEKFMLLQFPSVSLVKIESVFSDRPGAQHITKKPILEVPSQQIRNKLLSDVEDKDIQFTCLTHAIGINKAKTQQQRNRNTAVLKAFDKIKAHESTTRKSVTIEFKIKDSWDRTVSVDKEIVFLQHPGESLGTFSGAFASLSVQKAWEGHPSCHSNYLSQSHSQLEIGISSCFSNQLDAASLRFARQLPGNKPLRRRGPRSYMAILRRRCKVPRPPTVEASGVSGALSTGVPLEFHISSASSSRVSPVSHNHSSSLPQAFVNSS